jgi:hypothetical protein
LSPDVSHHIYCTTSRELDVLLDVEDQVVDERLVWIIREDDLHNQAERDGWRMARIQCAELEGLTARTHLLRTALCGD